MSMNLSDIAILNIKGSDYHCIISLISKNEVIKFLQNADLTEKSGTLLKTLIIVNLKKNTKVFEIIYKNGKRKIYKIW